MNVQKEGVNKKITISYVKLTIPISALIFFYIYFILLLPKERYTKCINVFPKVSTVKAQNQ